MENILGVVLCGGQSKRMGTDKGLIPIGDTIRAKYIADKLGALNIPVVFSVNELQHEQYAVHVSSHKLIIDNADVQGPLKGLLSVHTAFPKSDLLLLACDMLDLDKATIVQIITLYKTTPVYDFYVYQDIEYAQPFCGIYTSRRLSEWLLKAQTNNIATFSMQKILNEGKTKRLPIINHAAFRNYNVASD